MGHYLADRQYVTITDCQREQVGSTFCNYTNTGHPHLDVEEFFNPNLPSDPFQWIPQGIFHDLRDPANETNFPVPDQVSGYSNQQMFNAFQSDIYTLQDYRIKLIQQNNSQTSEIINLFNQYGY